jgi:hypothetical protein
MKTQDSRIQMNLCNSFTSSSFSDGIAQFELAWPLHQGLEYAWLGAISLSLSLSRPITFCFKPQEELVMTSAKIFFILQNGFPPFFLYMCIIPRGVLKLNYWSSRLTDQGRQCYIFQAIFMIPSPHPPHPPTPCKRNYILMS